MTRMPTDVELVTAYAAGRDEAAFGALVARHGRMVYRVCFHALGDAHDAEDATQATFLVLAEKAAGLKRQGELSAWLYGVAQRVSAHAKRGRAVRAKHHGQAGAAAREASGGGAEAEAERSAEAVRRLHRELEALSETLRQAILLRYFQGLSEQDAAKAAGCAPNTLSKRVSLGIARLRERLGAEGAVLSVGALAALLEAEGRAAWPPGLEASCAKAGQGAAESTARAWAQGAMKQMIRKQWLQSALLVSACLVLSATLVPLLAATGGGAAPAERPAPPPAVPGGEAKPEPKLAAGDWPAFEERGVGYDGAFTPDGKHFVYAMLPKPGESKSELRALELATGRTRSLGAMALKPIAPARPGFDEGLWLAVHAATNALDAVFVGPEALDLPRGTFAVWKPQDAKLVRLPTALGDGVYLGSSEDGTLLAFQRDRSPADVAILDATRMEQAAAIAKPQLERMAAYRAEYAWAGGELIAFSVSGKGAATATEIRRVWPKEEVLGSIPSSAKTLLTGTG
ncbi:MAG: hypothetical protein AMXMBFR7_49840 [Planctomycetota bacterium]